MEYLRTTLSSLEGFGSEQIAFVDKSVYADAKSNGVDLSYDRMLYYQEIDDMMRGEFVINLDMGILNCPQPLVPGVEVKFSFERAPATFALFYKDEKATTKPKDLDGKVVNIAEAFLELEYVSSPYLRNLNSTIIEKPITYYYDDCQIYYTNCAKGTTTLRVSSLCGGLTPEYLFAGFMRAKSLSPDFETTCGNFVNPGIRDVNITLNGASVHGYPISSFLPNNVTQLYSRFIQTLGRFKKTVAGGTITQTTFKDDFCLISHHFEGQMGNEGYIGFDVKFDAPAAENYVFVVFTIRNNALTIDRFHKVTKALF